MARYVAKFTKGKGVKFISHLDLMHSIERAIRRSGIPVSYSKGFNPHTELSFATPLSVGVWSTGEYMDFKLTEEMDTNIIIDKMNSSLPPDIRILSVKKVEEQFPSLMSIVDASSFKIILVHIPEGRLTEETIKEFMDRKTMEILKVGKSGTRLVDIRPIIYSMKLDSVSSEELVISTVVASGSKSNLNPELLTEALKKYMGCIDEAEIRDIEKMDTFVRNNGMFVTPMEIAFGSGRK